MPRAAATTWCFIRVLLQVVNEQESASDGERKIVEVEPALFCYVEAATASRGVLLCDRARAHLGL